MGRKIKTLTRTFNGKTYRTVGGWSYKKREVQRVAKRERNKGYNVRIVKSSHKGRTFYHAFRRKKR